MPISPKNPLCASASLLLRVKLLFLAEMLTAETLIRSIAAAKAIFHHAAAAQIKITKHYNCSSKQENLHRSSSSSKIPSAPLLLHFSALCFCPLCYAFSFAFPLD